VKQLLDAIVELMGLFLADVLDPRPVMAERGIAIAASIRASSMRLSSSVKNRRCVDAAVMRSCVSSEFRAHRVGDVAGANETA
jgi:hypothetical protein